MNASLFANDYDSLEGRARRERRKAQLAEELKDISERLPEGTEVRGYSDGYEVTGIVESITTNMLGRPLVLLVGGACFYPHEVTKL